MSQELSATIQALASGATTLIALIALIQIRMMSKQIKTDHERSRRHQAVEDLRDWNNHLTEGITSARRLVETFSDDQLEAVKEGKSIRLLKKYKAIAQVALDIAQDTELKEDGDSYILEPSHAIRIRNHCIKHLNAFEITLAAWRHGIADKKIIEEQLSYLVDLNRDWKMLEKFRKQVVGLDAHPATEEFVQRIIKLKISIDLEKKRIEDANKPKGQPQVA